MASDGNMLPSPALTGKNGEYIFNQTGVDTIKSELVNGRAVSIAFYGDQSAPGQELSADDDNFISFFDKDGNPTTDKLVEYWTHYTYDKEYRHRDLLRCCSRRYCSGNSVCKQKTQISGSLSPVTKIQKTL